MPRYRAGAYDKGTKKKGRYFVVEASSEAGAVLDVRHLFPGVALARMFAAPAEPGDKVDGTVHTFKPESARGAS
jgi:hypothetical protein